MDTFLAFLHMGSVECVTAQVPWSHSRGGDVKLVEDGRVGLYLRGERRVIGVLTAAVGNSEELGTSTVMVVPPGDSPGTRAELSVEVAGSAIFAGMWLSCSRRLALQNNTFTGTHRLIGSSVLIDWDAKGGV